jgi:hypothetical protein
MATRIIPGIPDINRRAKVLKIKAGKGLASQG